MYIFFQMYIKHLFNLKHSVEQLPKKTCLTPWWASVLWPAIQVNRWRGHLCFHWVVRCQPVSTVESRLLFSVLAVGFTAGNVVYLQDEAPRSSVGSRWVLLLPATLAVFVCLYLRCSSPGLHSIRLIPQTVWSRSFYPTTLNQHVQSQARCYLRKREKKTLKTRHFLMALSSSTGEYVKLKRHTRNQICVCLINEKLMKE